MWGRRIVVCVSLSFGCADDDGGSGGQNTAAIDDGTTRPGDGSPEGDDGEGDDVVDDGELGEGEGSCTGCCNDNITFTVEDGRAEYILTINASGQSANISCPDQIVTGAPWDAVCDGASVQVDSEGTAFSSTANETVQLDGGAPQSFGGELDVRSCDCNCVPWSGDIVVLLDPTAGATGTSGDSTGGDTGGTTGTTS